MKSGREILFVARVTSLLGCLMLCASACEIGPNSGAGLRLPNGDVVAGKQAFRELGCEGCHSIVGESSANDVAPREIDIELGGKVAHIATHGELMTSIVNPSHGFDRRYAREEVTEGGASKMKNFNDRMTVKQLIDLMEYLQSKYDLELDYLYAH